MIAVKALSGEHKISTLCRVLRVNRSTYYKFLNHQPSKREITNQHIRQRIVELYSTTDKRLGVHKLRLCLLREDRINISDGRVYRLLKSMNLPQMSTKKPFKPAKAKDSEGTCVNYLSQKFNPSLPNKVWVSDFTYIKAGGRYYYLCAIMDLFSRKIIAFNLSAHIDSALAIRTVNDAVKERGVSYGVLFHTDRGSQYTSREFRKHLDSLGMIQSFSKKGHPYDNAVMECFFKYLKAEETDRRSYASFDELQLAVFKYIIGFYNQSRPHSHNNGLSPNQAESYL
mgnify:CR=1 FL=1